MDMKEIHATRGLVVMVDDDDYEKLIAYKWSFNNGYANSSRVGMMHRVIMGNPNGQVDHINGNRADNRRCNLRLATQKENSQNKTKFWGKSKYKGVLWDNKSECWQSRIFSQGKSIFLGNFRNEQNAAQAYNEAALKYFGEFSALNVIDGYTTGTELARQDTMYTRKTSPFRGVIKDKERGCYMAKIVCGEVKRSKRFTSNIAAAIWYNTQAKELYGERAFLNDIPPGYEAMSAAIEADPLAHTPKENVASRQRCVFRNGNQWMVRIRKDKKTLFQKNYATENDAAEVSRSLLLQYGIT